MNNYNPNIHHRKSIRLKGYDYSQAGLYFITICVKNRDCFFGEIKNGKMLLNNVGKIANECWLEIPKHFPYTVLHEHIVMPNHVHGIVELIKTGSRNDSGQPVGVQNFEPLPSPNISPRNEFQKIIPHSIGSIIRGYKIGVTKWFRNNTVGAENFLPVLWQRNYYEHIIRNEQSCEQIADYIINNPKNWKDDDFFNFTSPIRKTYKII